MVAMSERAFEHLGSHEGRNNFANVRPIFIKGTSFLMVVFGALPPVSSQPSMAWKLKGKKRAASTPPNKPIGGKSSDVAITNIIVLYEVEWCHFNQGFLVKKHWTRIREEHKRQMSHKLKRLKAHIKDKIEKLKAEYQRQKTLPKE